MNDSARHNDFRDLHLLLPHKSQRGAMNLNYHERLNTYEVCG